jgi:adenylate kinase family enzyme
MYYLLEREDRFKRDFLAVYFDIPRDVAVQRILDRSKIEFRSDDTFDAINVRIEAYLNETFPVIKNFESL